MFVTNVNIFGYPRTEMCETSNEQRNELDKMKKNSEETLNRLKYRVHLNNILKFK
jgi:hypothetical protein